MKRLAEIIKQRDAAYNERFTKVDSSIDTISRAMDLVTRSMD